MIKRNQMEEIKINQIMEIKTDQIMATKAMVEMETETKVMEETKEITIIFLVLLQAVSVDHPTIMETMEMLEITTIMFPISFHQMNGMNTQEIMTETKKMKQFSVLEEDTEALRSQRETIKITCQAHLQRMITKSETQ